MVLCTVPWCNNRSDHRDWKRSVNSGHGDHKITFHSFPKNAATRGLWLDILGINSPFIPSGARICSIHFEEKFFDRTSLSKVRLKPNALPRVKTSTSKTDQATITSLEDSSKVSNEFPSTCKADKSTMTSFELIYNYPEKSRLRKRLQVVKEESRKKIRSLQQNLRRQTNQIATLKSVLKTLREKQLRNEEQSNMLHTLGGSNGAIFNRLIRRRSNESVPRQYEPELRSFI